MALVSPALPAKISRKITRRLSLDTTGWSTLLTEDTRGVGGNNVAPVICMACPVGSAPSKVNVLMPLSPPSMLWTTLNPDALILRVGNVGMEGVDERGKEREDCDTMLGNLEPALEIKGLLCDTNLHTWEPKDFGWHDCVMTCTPDTVFVKASEIELELKLVL